MDGDHWWILSQVRDFCGIPEIVKWKPEDLPMTTFMVSWTLSLIYLLINNETLQICIIFLNFDPAPFSNSFQKCKILCGSMMQRTLVPSAILLIFANKFCLKHGFVTDIMGARASASEWVILIQVL